MQYMVAGMMFGQGNYLAHYGRKGMKWGKNIFGDDYEGGRQHTTAPRVSLTNEGIRRARYNRTMREASAAVEKAQAYRAEQDRKRQEQRDYLNSPRGKIENAAKRVYYNTSRGVRNAYNTASGYARTAYNTASGYANRGIDAVSNRDEYARMVEAQQSGNDQLAAQLAEEYNSHWMTRAQGAINRGTSFVQNLFSKISGAVKDAAGKAVSYAKSTWNQIKTKAAPYVNAAKSWLEQLWNKAKGAVNRGVVKAKTSYMRFQNERRANQARADIRARQEAARKRHSGFLGTPGN